MLYGCHALEYRRKSLHCCIRLNFWYNFSSCHWPVVLAGTNFSDLKGSKDLADINFEPGYYEELVEGKFPDATATILEALRSDFNDTETIIL